MDTKKLRQKILDLAIRGKLVPQDPNDEPASVLLERIKAEKEQLIKDGKIKRSKKSASSDTYPYENVPFQIPESWAWTTIGDISLSILYGVSESAKSEGKYKLLRITDIQNNKVNWDTVPYSDFEDNVQNYILEEGDILFARTGATVGKSYLVNKISISSIYASYLIRVKSSKLVLPAYVKSFFESGFYWEQISMNAVGVGQPNVNGTSLANLRIPLPPYNEQIRIVKESTNWLKRNDILDNDIVELGNAIEHIKSKILDLAIHGKLVPQDPNDEPAIELLRRINPNFKPCDNAHYQYNLPDNWEWTTLGNIGKWQSGGTPDRKNKSYYNGEIPWLRIADLQDDYITEATEFITQEGLNNSSTKFNPIGSVALAMYGSIGKVGILTFPSTTNQAICVCSNYIIAQKYLFYYLISQRDNFFMQAGGGVQANISKQIIVKHPIPIPPYAEQKRIVAKIEELFVAIDKIKESLEA